MESLKQVKAEWALGTYQRWYLHIWNHSSFEDPPTLRQILIDTLPYCEVWSGGMYIAYGTKAHMLKLKYALNHIEITDNERRFNFHAEEAPDRYYKISLKVECEDVNGIKKVWLYYNDGRKRN